MIANDSVLKDLAGIVVKDQYLCLYHIVGNWNSIHGTW